MAKPSTPSDVRQLQKQSLPTSAFPAARQQDFRVHFAADVHEQMAQHAAQDTSVEIGGVLVGKWGRDEDGPFVTVCELIRCLTANSQAGQVTGSGLGVDPLPLHALLGGYINLRVMPERYPHRLIHGQC